jgi:prophage regulatory protein
MSLNHPLEALGTLPASGYIRQKQLLDNHVPFSPATLWRKVKAGTFPLPVKLSDRVTAWSVADVRQWAAQQAAAMPQPCVKRPTVTA